MFPSYLSVFISEYVNLSAEDGFLHEDRLATLYYAYAMKCKNKFVSAWFGFNLVINNVLVALTALPTLQQMAASRLLLTML